MIKTLVIFFYLLITIILITPNSLVSASPDLITDKSTSPINPNQKMFYIYFHYGNPTGTKNIVNKSLSLEIQGEQFKIDRQNVYDLYSDNISLVSCNASYTGKSYQISPNLIENKKINNYGPRTSKYKFSTLEPRFTGCLKVGVKVSDNKSANVSNKFVFNENANQSISYKDSEIPGKQEVSLYLGGKTACQDNQTSYNGKCLDSCINGNARNTAGKCVKTNSTCKIGEESVAGKCLTICPSGREDDGDCKKEEISKSNQIINWLLNGIIIAVIALLVFGIWKNTRKIKT